MTDRLCELCLQRGVEEPDAGTEYRERRVLESASAHGMLMRVEPYWLCAVHARIWDSVHKALDVVRKRRSATYATGVH